MPKVGSRCGIRNRHKPRRFSGEKIENSPGTAEKLEKHRNERRGGTTGHEKMSSSRRVGGAGMVDVPGNEA